ncbi:protein of unknown function (plasmid) [Candidatus Methylocalor cossyra]|uniref:type I site-specific deoxyribonuclease n=1 Tax=Candidatus Methylocalor cossyra TaxID=3108543 RepID=A0ABP1CCZ1_9GAMM
MAVHKLCSEAKNHNRSLHGNNQAVYNVLRYGVPVKTEAGKVTETIRHVDWTAPDKNDFAIAVLELKNSRIGDGIRQSISNQQAEFNAWFFSTVQFIFAGNDSEDLRYGTIGTPEKYFLKWKGDEKDRRCRSNFSP